MTIHLLCLADAIWRHRNRWTVFQIMACRLGSSDIRLKEGSFPRDTSIIIHTSIRLTITHSKFHSNLQGVQESTRKLLNISIYGPTSSILLSAQLTQFRISNHPNNIRKIMSIFAVSKLPTVGQAPRDDRPSLGTMISSVYGHTWGYSKSVILFPIFRLYHPNGA